MIRLKQLFPKALNLTGMKSALGIGRPSSAPVGLLAVLSRMLPAAELEAILMELSDKRFLVEEIAKRYNKSPEIVMAEVARLARMEYTADIPSVDLAKLAEIGRSLGEFAAAGCIPVLGAGGITQIICIDPKTVLSLLAPPPGVSFKFSTWEQINEAIERSKAEFERAQLEAREQRAKKMAELARRALVALVKEVGSYQRSAFSVHFQADTIAYEFHTVAGKRAQGTINPHVTESLRDLLSRGVLEDGIEIRLGDSGEVVALKISGDPGCYRVRWGIEALREDTPSQEHAATRIASTKGDEAPASPSVEQHRVPQKDVGDVKGAISRNDAPLILVVDDNPTFATVVQRFLERHGCQTAYYGSAIEADKELDNAPVPALIVCDVHMPEMNGFEFVRRLREREKFAAVAVVMLTSDDDAETEIRLISDGADSFVAKNEDPRVLWAHINRLLDRRAKKQEAA